VSSPRTTELADLYQINTLNNDTNSFVGNRGGWQMHEKTTRDEIVSPVITDIATIMTLSQALEKKEGIKSLYCTDRLKKMKKGVVGK